MAVIYSKLTWIITDSIVFRIEDSICVNNDRNDDSKNSESIDLNIEFRQNRLDRYACSTNKTVLANAPWENCLCDLYGSRDFGMAVILSCSRTLLLIIVSEVEQTYQQNGCKLRAEVFLSATIFCNHFNIVSKLMR